jgi:hypothetical protein
MTPQNVLIDSTLRGNVNTFKLGDFFLMSHPQSQPFKALKDMSVDSMCPKESNSNPQGDLLVQWTSLG